MIYALLFAVLSAVAAVYAWVAEPASAAQIGRIAQVVTFGISVLFLALAKFSRRKELPFP